MRIELRKSIALGAGLAYGGTLWLVLVHVVAGGHERSEPPLLLHWLRDASLALPGVVAAVAAGMVLMPWLLDREARLGPAWRSALVVAGAAIAAALALAAGNPIHGALFDARESHGLAGMLHVGRDALLALGATFPLALLAPVLATRLPSLQSRRRSGRLAAEGVVLVSRSSPMTFSPGVAPGAARTATAGVLEPGVASAERGAAAPHQPPLAPARVTRRAFVGYGAATVAAGGLGTATVARSPRAAHAQLLTDRLHLFVNEGHVPMVDGSLVYMRGFGSAAADDPDPSLTIDPQIFLADGSGPVASRHYPLVEPDRLPPDGAPPAAGIDPAGVGLHTIRKRFWASYFPSRTIVAESGSEIRLRVTNRLAQPHAFAVDGVASVTLAPGETRDLDFAAPAPGTYIYHDPTDAPVNRVLGLHGVLVVIPTSNRWTFDGREGEFERQWVWLLHDIDPEWARRARMGAPIDPVATPPHPRYFTLNGRSGAFSAAISPDEESNHRTHEDTSPGGHARRVDVRDFSSPEKGAGQLIRLVNTGIAIHQPHFHGNHVWTIAADNKIFSRSTPSISDEGHVEVQFWEDVVELSPARTKAVILPLKPPPDALEEVLEAQDCEYQFPMHCHAEMSQTAGGGLYPGGMVSDWRLLP